MPNTVKSKAKGDSTDKRRLRREIVEMTEGQHRLGLVDADEVEQVTLRMLGRKALRKEPPKAAAKRQKSHSPR